MGDNTVGFGPWWCRENADKSILKPGSLQVEESLLLASTTQAYRQLSRFMRKLEELSHSDLTEEQQRRTAMSEVYRGHAGRTGTFGEHARPLAEVWHQPSDCTVGALADLIIKALRQAWWEGIPDEHQDFVGGGVGIDYLHKDHGNITLAPEQIQMVSRLHTGASQEVRENALAMELAHASLRTSCMPISQRYVEGDLPSGCTMRTPLPPAESRRSRPTVQQQMYMRIQIASRLRDYAHRWVAWLRFGPPPNGDRIQAVHLCNNKNCLNPYHLCWVSPGWKPDL